MEAQTRKDVKFLGVNLPRDMAVALRRRAREEDLTMSQFVRRLIAASLVTRGDGR